MLLPAAAAADCVLVLLLPIVSATNYGWAVVVGLKVGLVGWSPEVSLCPSLALARQLKLNDAAQLKRGFLRHMTHHYYTRLK